MRLSQSLDNITRSHTAPLSVSLSSRCTEKLKGFYAVLNTVTAIRSSSTGSDGKPIIYRDVPTSIKNIVGAIIFTNSLKYS